MNEKNNSLKKCLMCDAYFSGYPYYEYDLLDSRGYSEVWICLNCGNKKKIKR